VSRLSPEHVAIAGDIISRYPVARSALIPLVHLAQEQDGFVANDAMEHIAELIGCSPAEVYGTATFYEMFKFEPVGTYVLGICTNISCLLNGAYELLDHAEQTLGIRTGATSSDGLFTLEDVECVAACTDAPCLQVNYRYFANVSNADLDQIIGDLRAGRLDASIPSHGTLARIRQTVAPERWAGSGVAPPPVPPATPVAALPAPARAPSS
jgi:NADH-quinone oxidoreductase subunit E